MSLALAVISGAGCLPLPAEPKSPENPVPQSDGAAPRQRCAGTKPGMERRKCFEREFTAADRKLNAVYKQLRAALPEAVRADLKDNSIGWIRMKEYNCEFQSEMLRGATDEARHTEFLRCSLDYTTERTDYLRRAFGREGVAPGTAGEYDDGFSGSLEFESIADKNNRYRFKLEVVRGPTAHIGEIGGEVVVKDGESGVFAERPECGGASPGSNNATSHARNADPARRSEPCCRLDFRLGNQKGFRTIEVKETNCGYYHGARAYFDGLYRKIK